MKINQEVYVVVNEAGEIGDDGFSERYIYEEREPALFMAKHETEVSDEVWRVETVKLVVV